MLKVGKREKEIHYPQPVNYTEEHHNSEMPSKNPKINNHVLICIALAL